jgi:hypothetical protein
LRLYFAIKSGGFDMKKLDELVESGESCSASNSQLGGPLFYVYGRLTKDLGRYMVKHSDGNSEVTFCRSDVSRIKITESGKALIVFKK